MKTLLELVAGDEIQAFLRTGLALEVGRDKEGIGYRYVPNKPQKASHLAIARFQGTVVFNDINNRVIMVDTVGINHKRTPLASSPAMRAEISYTAFSRVFLLSKINFEPKEERRRSGSAFRPTTVGLGTNYKPYRTLEAVHIPNANST
jgi:hypothetical protein